VAQPAEEGTLPGCINKEQRALLWADARRAGWADAELKRFLQKHGINSTREIQCAHFDNLLAIVRSGGSPEPFKASDADLPKELLADVGTEKGAL
jgi:hypothetical protein